MPHLPARPAAFKYSSAKELKVKIAEIEETNKNGGFREHRYGSAFESVPILCYYKSKRLRNSEIIGNSNSHYVYNLPFDRKTMAEHNL